jgi:type II secretory pathway pseudopilin PulG
MIPPRFAAQRSPRRTGGVVLLTVVFIMVVLGLVAALLAESLMGQYATGNLARLERQARFAAASGIEWGRDRALQAATCGTSQISIADFTVTVTCTTLQVTEGSAVYDMFDIGAEAVHGTYGNPDFMRRSAQGRYSNR